MKYLFLQMDRIAKSINLVIEWVIKALRNTLYKCQARGFQLIKPIEIQPMEIPPRWSPDRPEPRGTAVPDLQQAVGSTSAAEKFGNWQSAARSAAEKFGELTIRDAKRRREFLEIHNRGAKHRGNLGELAVRGAKRRGFFGK